MAKRKVSKLATEITKFAEEKKLVIGTDLTLKKLRAQKLAKIFISSNAPQDVVETINRYSALHKTEVTQVPQTNEELGVICKKPYHVSVLSVRKE